MPELRFFERTWLDREFQKTFRKLPKKEKERFEEELGDLLEALEQCRHPMTDPALGRWRPTGYRLRRASFPMVEYRLRRLTRVIAGFQPTAEGEIAMILLLCVTLRHDHQRLQRIIEQHQSDLRDELPS